MADKKQIKATEEEANQMAFLLNKHLPAQYGFILIIEDGQGIATRSSVLHQGDTQRYVARALRLALETVQEGFTLKDLPS